VDPLQRLYLGGLTPGVTADDVRGLFATFGEPAAIDLITDRATGEPRGFGFVTLAADAAARAVADLDGLPWRGGTLRVNPANDRGARPPRRSW